MNKDDLSARISWYFNSRPLEWYERRLKLNRLSYEHHGEYKCVASNEFGRNEKSFDLQLVPTSLNVETKTGKQENWIKIQVLSNPQKDHVENGTIKLKCLSGKLNKV